MPASGEVEGYGPQTATVTDVRDPEGLGRVQVTIPVFKASAV